MEIVGFNKIWQKVVASLYLKEDINYMEVIYHQGLLVVNGRVINS